MTTPRTTSRIWRRLATLAAVALIATTTGLGHSAGASEFQPELSASITAGCAGGAAFHVALANEGNAPGDLHLTLIDTTDQFGIPDVTPEQLVGGDSTTVDLPVTDGHSYHLGVYSDWDQTTLAEIDHTFDCSQPLAGSITLECGFYPMLSFDVDNTDTVGHHIVFHYPDATEQDFDPLAPGQSAGYGFFTYEGHHLVASITDGATVIATYDGTVDCEDPSASITLDCSGDQPMIDYELVEHAKTYAIVDLWLDGDEAAGYAINSDYPNGTRVVQRPVAEDAPFVASAVDHDMNVELAHLEGVADCTPPETVPPSTVPPVGEPPTTEPPATVPATTDPTDPTTTVAPETSTTAPAAEVSAVTARPSFTG